MESQRSAILHTIHCQEHDKQVLSIECLRIKTHAMNILKQTVKNIIHSLNKYWMCSDSMSAMVLGTRETDENKAWRCLKSTIIWVTNENVILF